MVDPASGPFLFDTSAESWLGRTGETEVRAWLCAYLSHYEIQLSAVTVIERIHRRRPGERINSQNHGRSVWHVGGLTP